MTGVRRIDGFAPIESYAVIGDGRTVALIANDGQIDWWPFPTIDSPPLIDSILDATNGGRWSLAPEEPFESSRRYIDRTNVLETTFSTAHGSVRVTDSLNVGSGGRLPWTELARRVEGIEGELTLLWEFAAGDCFGQARPWTTKSNGVPTVHLGEQRIAFVVDGAVDVETTTHAIRGRVHSTEGQRALLAAIGTSEEPLFLPEAQSILKRCERTVRTWRDWSTEVDASGRFGEAKLRSALALKTLLYEPTGFMAAAATTSLPETIGGPKNWDYRYAWVRDSSFALDALIHLGLHEEVHRSVSWLIGALRGSAPRLQVCYSLTGDRVPDETELDVPGYRNSRPVRSGNRAINQLQLGTYGDFFDTIHRYVDEGHVLDKGTAVLLSDLADQCCDRWARPDSGIWELPEVRHYTISKIGCWVALDRADKLAHAGQLSTEHAKRWRNEADEIKQWVNTWCWSEKKQSYTFFAGGDSLDAAVLLAERTGFERGGRLLTTIDAITNELARGPLVYRYSGMDKEEGAFVACTFWLVDALARAGRRDAACDLMEEAVRMTNDVGLLSEQIGESGAFLGNFPQGLSHLSLINAACTLEQARTD